MEALRLNLSFVTPPQLTVDGWGGGRTNNNNNIILVQKMHPQFRLLASSSCRDLNKGRALTAPEAPAKSCLDRRVSCCVRDEILRAFVHFDGQLGFRSKHATGIGLADLLRRLGDL